MDLMNPTLPVAVWPAELQLGEGPLWHAASQRFFFVEVSYADRLYRRRCGWDHYRVP